MSLGKTISLYALRLVVVLFFVSLGSFLLVRALPGDPAKTLGNFGTPAQIAQIRHEIGTDKPWYEQYRTWLGNLVQGDFGRDYALRRPVADIVSESLPQSILLMIYAQVLTLLVSVPLAIFAAYRAGGLADKTINFLAFGFLALPVFVLSFYLILIFAVNLEWLPSQGYVPISDGVVDHVKSMVLPTLALALGQIAIYMRLLRSDLIATLQENFITVARAKGISDRRTLFRHALRPSSLTLLTVAGVNVGALIGGTVLVDYIFQLNGFGFQINAAISSQQYVMMQSLIVILAVFYVLLNFVVDVLYAVLDPRVRDA